MSLALAALLVAGCAKTTRIDDESFSLRRLRQENRGIALLRVGAASWKCVHVAVMLGQRVDNGSNVYRRVKVLGVANVRSVASAPVGEVELDAGEYHVVAYSCTNDKGSRIVADDTGAGSALYRTSYARFTLGAGEVVNLGYLHFQAANDGGSLYGQAIKTEVTASNWPLDEIARFERTRPHLFGAMTARLIETGDPGLTLAEKADACDKWRSLASAGKTAGVPAACAVPGPAESGDGRKGVNVTTRPQHAKR